MAKRGSGGIFTLVIEPRIEGARSLLSDVIDQLESLTRLLRSLSDDATTIEVVSITKKSPLTAELRTVHRTKVKATKKKPGSYRYRDLKAPVKRFEGTLQALTSAKRLPAYADVYSLVQLRDFADGLVKSGSIARIQTEDHVYTVDERLRSEIDSRLGKARISYTSYTGTLERLNVHGSRWSFTIYPLVGPTRILCYFDKEKLDEVKTLVKDVVTVRGRAVYREESPWPEQIRVDSIVAKRRAPDGTFASMPTVLESDWLQASDADRDLMDLLEEESA